MAQTLPYETSTVTAEKTASEIEDMLREAGVAKVGKTYENNKVKAIYFQMDTPKGSMPFTLPVNVDAVYQIMITKKKNSSRRDYRITQRELEERTHAQAERTAWRIIRGRWWWRIPISARRWGRSCPLSPDISPIRQRIVAT